MKIKKPEKPELAHVHFRVPRDVKKRLEEAAKRHGVSMNELAVQVFSQMRV